MTSSVVYNTAFPLSYTFSFYHSFFHLPLLSLIFLSISSLSCPLFSFSLSPFRFCLHVSLPLSCSFLYILSLYLCFSSFLSQSLSLCPLFHTPFLTTSPSISLSQTLRLSPSLLFTLSFYLSFSVLPLSLSLFQNYNVADAASAKKPKASKNEKENSSERNFRKEGTENCILFETTSVISPKIDNFTLALYLLPY